MALLLSAEGLAKSFGPQPLFRNISFTISEGERLGLIGPNGSGKSTLLEILAGTCRPDSGSVTLRKGVRLSRVSQVSDFRPEDSVRSVVEHAMDKSESHHQALRRPEEILGRAGFSDFDLDAVSLSGGWRKRLAIAAALASNPDVLLLDEPTNHLDLAGIEWLESLLQSSRFACIVVSHDRYFLENVATEMAELNRAYADGILRVRGNYSAFLEKKSGFLLAQAKRQEALENRVRTEMEWLRRGPKARGTKAKARIDAAQQIIGELVDLNVRSRTSAAAIDFAATDRKTKRLVELKEVRFRYGQRLILDRTDFTVVAGMRIGLVGANGSGKTTILRLIRGEIEPDAGEIVRAPSLRVVYFDQNRPLDPNLTLRRTLAPEGDSVVYQGRTIHVASWADRFLFPAEQLNQPVGRLSGGERARVLIAGLMLQPADVLLLDEPTNDLDIPTLEILEEALLEFGGALVLVTHDRYLLDRVSTIIWGLNGQGCAESFASYSQWEAWQAERSISRCDRSGAARPSDSTDRKAAPSKKKLSYLEQREFDGIEERITAAERELAEWRSLLADSAVLRDSQRLQEAYQSAQQAQAVIEDLYNRWAELDQKSNG